MSQRSFVLVTILFLLPLLAPSAIQAQGIIIPRPCDVRPRCPRPIPPVAPMPVSLPVKSISLETKIRDQVATTKVVQVFENRTPYTLEGIYFFPLPEDASVSQFAVWEEGKKLTGEVMLKEEARRIYESIVRTMRDPGLLEYAGKNLMKASIFPIPPRSEKKIELEYSQILRSDNGTVAYEYPLGSGRTALNARPADSGPVGPKQEFGTVSGRIEISGKGKVKNVYSPSHVISSNLTKEGTAVVTFESKGDPSDLDLYYTLKGEDIGMSLLTYREPGKDGYYLLMVSPDDGQAERSIVAKDVIFVLDTSGSMADEGKLDKARPALNFGISALNEGDRFNVIGFSGEERLLENGLLEANTANRKRAKEFLGGLKPAGGTNIHDAILAALEQFDGRDRPKMLVLLTDGLPTVGERDVVNIVNAVKEKKINGLRLFTFGVGYDVNTRLLDSLGSENSGLSGYVEPKEDIEVKVSSFFEKVNSPVLSDITIDLGAVRTNKDHPRRISDLFRGLQAVMIGRYSNERDLSGITLRLTGSQNGKARTFTFDGLSFPLRSDRNDFLPRLWASRRVGWLVEQIRINGESKELKEEVIDLGTRFGLVTPYTSYLAADGNFVTRETEGNRFRMDAPAAASISGELRKESGKDAVRQSVQQNALQDNLYVRSAENDSGVRIFLDDRKSSRFIANKHFLRDGDSWVDSEYESGAGLPEVVLQYGSDAYFDVALSESGLARYLSLGRNVVVVWKGKVYRVKG